MKYLFFVLSAFLVVVGLICVFQDSWNVTAVGVLVLLAAVIAAVIPLEFLK